MGGGNGEGEEQAFNCVNGDVFTWNVMCEVFEVEFVEFDESQPGPVLIFFRPGTK